MEHGVWNMENHFRYLDIKNLSTDRTSCTTSRCHFELLKKALPLFIKRMTTCVISNPALAGEKSPG